MDDYFKNLPMNMINGVASGQNPLLSLLPDEGFGKYAKFGLSMFGPMSGGFSPSSGGFTGNSFQLPQQNPLGYLSLLGNPQNKLFGGQ